MSATSDAPHTVRLHTMPVRPPDARPDIELLARRALGMAMNALHNGGRIARLETKEPSLVEQAKDLLEHQVPAGPELVLALDLLDRTLEPSTSADATPSIAH